ncbi:hypothetical protein [Nocardiopsis dassonvillei]|uniref:hypothetical protein n=1 Tax=Nocardiopsis dassonvillei TaxID=2014 RepID=UPI00157CBE9E|nr:hypothetical protein [Nocardiopsis dassonvillei]
MREMSESQPCRPLRAGVFTLVCASVSAHGHALGSGHDVPLAGLLLGCAAVLGVSWAAAGRRYGPVMLVGWMLWGQLALHVAFSYTQNTGRDQSAHGAHSADAVTHSALSGWQMIAVHVLAALVSAWWLHRGENALFAFLRFMALTLLPLLLVLGWGPVPPVRAGGPGRWNDERPPSLLPYLRHTRVLRGPPSPLGAA